MTDIILLQLKNGTLEDTKPRTPTKLLSMASVPLAKGYEVVLIDQRMNENWRQDVKKHIDLGAKIIYFRSAEGKQLKYFMEATRFAISLDSKILTVLGGSWPQTQPGTCMQDTFLEIVSYVEDYYLLSDLMEFCERKKKMNEILGIFYRGIEGATIKKNDPRPISENPYNMRLPWYIINPKAYSAIEFFPSKTSSELLTIKNTQNSSTKFLLEELENLEKTYGVKDFTFQDGLITQNHEHFKEFVGTLAESGKDYKWSAAGLWVDQILSLDEKGMEDLVKSGCKTLYTDVESGNPRLLKLINKYPAVDNIKKVNQKLSNFPIKVDYKFQGGFPTETQEEFFDTLKLMKTLKRKNKYASTPLSFYAPFPGKLLYSTALEHGFKPRTSLKDWAENCEWYKQERLWLTKRMANLVENAAFISNFSNKKIGYKDRGFLFRILSGIYSPFAKIRFKHNLYGFMIEKSVAKIIQK